MVECVRVCVWKKKKSKCRKILKRIMLLFVFVLLVVVGLGGYKFYKIINVVDDLYDVFFCGNKLNFCSEVVDMKKKLFFILFMGIEDYVIKG